MKKRVNFLPCRGFTLMELLAVMSIMALLTTLAITSYFSAISSMARRSAVKHVVNTLILARQRACMEGTRVSVMFFNEPHGYKKDADGNLTTEEDFYPSYVVAKALGRLTYLSGDVIGDEFTELDKMFGTAESLGIQNASSYSGRLRLYNLTQGGWWMVLPFVTQYSCSLSYPYDTATGITSGGRIVGYGFTVKKSQGGAASSAIGDIYGVEAAPVGSLPRGFIIDGLTDAEAESDAFGISFLPDGSREKSATGVTGNKNSVTLIETRLPSNRPSNTIRVDDDGTINYSEKWN